MIIETVPSATDKVGNRHNVKYAINLEKLVCKVNSAGLKQAIVFKPELISHCLSLSQKPGYSFSNLMQDSDIVASP